MKNYVRLSRFLKKKISAFILEEKIYTWNKNGHISLYVLIVNFVSLTFIRIIAVSIDELHLILSLFLPFYKEGGIFKGGLNSLKNCLNAETS